MTLIPANAKLSHMTDMSQKYLVNNNEMVALQREPNNPYDKNAIKVNNVNGNQLKTEFDKLFEDLKEDDKTHEMEPAEAVETPLLPHQKQALAWMISRENSEELPPFWEQRSDVYYNTITNFSEKDRPENVHGGILADDMGLECNVYNESMKLGGNNTSEKADGLIKGASAVEVSKKADVEERPRTTLIICPLSVLSNWITKGDSPLHSIRWLRVILDEGHAIRNPNAQQTKAVLDLEAERRWVLTGTPIQNSLKDLWSLLSFLKLKPFLDREWWHRTIQRPVTMGDEGGLRYFNEGTVLAHYADVLGLLLRLRQICCHTHLLTNAVSSSGPSGNDTPEELRKTLIRKMKLILSSGSDEECAICLDSLTVPVITYCAHVFCKPCICQVIQNEQPHAKCPLCRNDIHGDNLLECPPEELACDTEKKSNMEWTSSSKINALMHALIDLRKKNPNIKSLVVSQFTTFLSLIETPLRASGFVFTRLDGSMAQKKRVESIQCFQNTEAGSPTIMLLSLKAGGVGLNLSAASRVFLMDPAWNPAAEDQCFDRCHRLGQKQEVIITKFIVKDSVEENMLKIQNTKRELAAGAFGTKKTNASDMKQAKINEIKTLIDL
ncbi:helicase-like transcription factor [Camelus ferus]|nr:helicase-like transcription factor [Camelus ferus]